MFDVVALGEVLIDFTFCGVSESGANLFEQNAGGAPANVMVACANFGLKTAFIGKIGADMHGVFLQRVLDNKGVDISGLIKSEDVFTTLAFVQLTASERCFSFARKPGADTCLAPSEIDLSIVKSAKVFHFGSLSLTNEPARSATLEAIKAAGDSGVVVSYDPNYRSTLWKNETEAIHRMRSVLEYVDIIKLSDEETGLLTGAEDPEKAAQELFDRGLSCVVVTLGKKGAQAFTRCVSTQKEPPKCTPVDTTGAGDSFWGGFLYKLVTNGKPIRRYNQEELEDTVNFANAAASLCIEGRGGIPSMPTLQEVKKRLSLLF